jgi:hypothetical protein
MVTAIGAIMNFTEKEKNGRVWLPVVISVGSYLTYVGALVLINVILEYNHGVETAKISVTALMTLGLEIPSSLLNGTRIGERNISEEKRKARDEDREFELKRLKMKYDAKSKLKSQTPPQAPQRSPRASQKPLNPVTKGARVEIAAVMDKAYERGGKVLAHSELVSMGYDKSTAWRHRNAWLEAHNLKGE